MGLPAGVFCALFKNRTSGGLCGFHPPHLGVGLFRGFGEVLQLHCHGGLRAGFVPGGFLRKMA